MISTKTPIAAKATITSQVLNFAHLLWRFTHSDSYIFVIVSSMFGIFTALSPFNLTTAPAPPVWAILLRLPLVLLFNWLNLLIFALSNQRLPESIKEDRLNKTDRPIVQGLITPDATRRLQLIAMPLIIAVTHAMGVSKQTLLISVGTYLINDLKGGDGIWFIRDASIAIATFIFNEGSLRVALGGLGAEITPAGYLWLAIVSAVIFTTMSVQDLNDQAGDAQKTRQTFSLVCGSQISRLTMGSFIVLWSVICARFWSVEGVAALTVVALGGYVTWRMLTKRQPKQDSNTWKLWCLWAVALHALPAVCRAQMAMC